ncbi:MAG: hypothetical protein FJ288_17345 [Planctomycetes bacterium]|nr:hypothetical protein [Planctomycetota bacterium]
MGEFLLYIVFSITFLAVVAWVIVKKLLGLFMAWRSERGQESTTPLKVGDTLKMREALDLIIRQGGEGSFVIFEEPCLRKFVQFAGSQTEGLLLDLPSPALSEDEMTRARDFFRELGVDSHAHVEVPDDNGRPAKWVATFQMKLGNDTRRAAQLACGVFLRVFRLSPDAAIIARVNLNA